MPSSNSIFINSFQFAISKHDDANVLLNIFNQNGSEYIFQTLYVFCPLNNLDKSEMIVGNVIFSLVPPNFITRYLTCAAKMSAIIIKYQTKVIYNRQWL